MLRYTKSWKQQVYIVVCCKKCSQYFYNTISEGNNETRLGFSEHFEIFDLLYLVSFKNLFYFIFFIFSVSNIPGSQCLCPFYFISKMFSFYLYLQNNKIKLKKKKSRREEDTDNLGSKQHMLVSDFCYCHSTIICLVAITKC